MKQTDTVFIGKLQDIADLQTEIKLLEEQYSSMLKADEPLEKLKQVLY